MPTTEQELERNPAFEEKIARALDETYRATVAADPPGGPPQVDLQSCSLVIFSDQHKGARNKADDFARCERAYNAALKYYLTAGHTLVELGDVEELWEERPGPVLDAYAYTLSLTRRFADQGRYIRIWGNHDDLWRYPDKVASVLGKVYGQVLRVREGIRLRVVNEGRAMGEIFLVHGHQGTSDSDRYSKVSRLFVRYIWRPIQRVFKVSLNTPAADWQLREQHSVALYEWALNKPGVVLISGHTHRPVFDNGRTLMADLQLQIDDAVGQLNASPGSEELRLKLARAQAALEWARSQDLKKTGPEGMLAATFTTPCYFNTGCCAFEDGDVTGLEICKGEIRLVRWPDDKGEPAPQVLATASLARIFAAHPPAGIAAAAAAAAAPMTVAGAGAAVAAPVGAMGG